VRDDRYRDGARGRDRAREGDGHNGGTPGKRARTDRLRRRSPTPEMVEVSLGGAHAALDQARTAIPALAAAVNPQGARDLQTAKRCAYELQLDLRLATSRLECAREDTERAAPHLLGRVEALAAAITAVEFEARPLLAMEPPTHATVADHEAAFLQDPDAMARLEAAEAREREQWNAMLDAHGGAEGASASIGNDKAPSGSGQARPTQAGGAVQRRQTSNVALDPAGVRDAAAAGVSGASAPLPHLDAIQQSFGHHDVSHVRAQVGGEGATAANAIGAEAYAMGDRAVFASSPDLRQAAHEAAHVVQQRHGVSLYGGVGQDGDAHEQHADRVADAVVRGESAASILDERAEHSSGAGNAIQAKKSKEKDEKKVYVPYQVEVTDTMTGEQFKVAAMKQVFGGVIENLEWQEIKDTYEPNTYTLRVEVGLLKGLRAQANQERGIDVDAEGNVPGAQDRWREFDEGASGDERDAILEEIDRRYYEASGVAPGTLIKPEEKGRAALWRAIRDEVLFQDDYLFMRLPDRVKELFSATLGERVPTPSEYEQMFRIARQIEAMPTGQAHDFVSRIVAATTDLDALEAALATYSAETATRGEQAKARETVTVKLYGLEALYQLYRDYRNAEGADSPLLAADVPAPDLATPLREELEAQLQANGFSSIAEFEIFINRFLDGFEQESANIARDLLIKYQSRLYRESVRYQDPVEIAALHRKLGGLRTEYATVEKDSKTWNDYLRKKQDARIPGQWQMQPSPEETEEGEAAGKRAAAAKAAAEAEFRELSDEHPIFQEDDLPQDKRIDKIALAKASEDELGALIQAQVTARAGEVNGAIDEIAAKPSLIYKIDRLMPQFYAQQGIAPGSIYDHIIQDKMQDGAITKLVVGIVVALVAIALTVVSMGAATPAAIAAVAAVGAAGLGVYQVYEALQEYEEDKALADANLIEDPSLFWVVVAIAGAGVDVGAAAGAIKALAPAAKALEATGDVAEFNRAVKALEEASEIDGKIARATEKAAAARQGYAEAADDLTRLLTGRAYSFPGPFTDPDVYKALVKMAMAKIKQGLASAEVWFAELKAARAAANMDEMTADELLKAKEAWEQASKMQARRPALAMERGATTPGTESEADSILQAETEGLVVGEARRTDRTLSEPNLDFRMTDPATGKPLGYVDIKTPVDPAVRPVADQATDVATKIKRYDSTIEVIVDLKNLNAADKTTFIAELGKQGVTEGGMIKFLNK